MLNRIKSAFFATLGSKSAQGELNRLDTIRALKGEWARYQGEQGICTATTREIAEFLNARYGVQMHGTHLNDRPLSRAERDALFERMAVTLLRQGAISFGDDDGPLG